MQNRTPPGSLKDLLEYQRLLERFRPRVLSKLVMNEGTFPTFRDLVLKQGGVVTSGQRDPATLLGSVPVESSTRCPVGYVVALDQHGEKMAVYKL